MSREQQTVPGVDAGSPSEIRRGWVQIVKRAWKEAKEDQVPLLSAGVAFYAFLAIVPTMIAVVMIYGLVTDEPADVTEQLESLGSALPSEAEELLSEQLEALATTPERSLGLGLLFALGLALWSASGGIGNLIKAVNVAYDEEDERGFVKIKALALGLTAGAIVFVVMAVALVAAVPVVLNALDVPGWVEALVEAGRWLVLVGAFLVALALLYQWAPDRESPRFRWLSVGSAVATGLWVVASVGFSVYVDNFSSYSKIYGSLAGVVVLLLWLWLTAYAALLGAEINAEMEPQTIKDTTTAEPHPLGERGAVKADSVPGGDDEPLAAPWVRMRDRVAAWFTARRRG